MDINFPLILVTLTALTGAIWLVDRFYLAPKRDPETPVHWSIEATAPFFPVLLVVLIVRSFLIEPFQIPSGSMIPTLLVGDFILVNKYAYGLRLPVTGTKIAEIGEPQRGDIMVFYPPGDDRYFIKRVIGLPGDEVRVVDNRLFVNGEEMSQKIVEDSGYSRDRSARIVFENLHGVEHLVRKQVPPGPFGVNYYKVVPEGHYFMMGDNRDNSQDSRAWGTVPEENIVGKAFAIWMHWEKMLSVPSFDRVGRIQ